MSLGTRRTQAAAKQKEPEFDIRKCPANACPVRGSVDLGNSGRFTCHCHAYAEPKLWPKITEGLRNNEWLIELITDLQTRFMSPDRDRSWMSMAEQFFADQPDMLPTPYERAAFPQYLTRLRMHLEWLCGARSSKPQPLERKQAPVRRGGNFGDVLPEAA